LFCFSSITGKFLRVCGNPSRKSGVFCPDLDLKVAKKWQNQLKKIPKYVLFCFSRLNFSIIMNGNPPNLTTTKPSSDA